jgi:HEXXH motif-containing protein
MTTETPPIPAAPRLGQPFHEAIGFSPDAGQHRRVMEEIVSLRLTQLHGLASLIRRLGPPEAESTTALLERLPELPPDGRRALTRDPVFHAAFTGLVTALRATDRPAALRALERLLGTVLLPAVSLLDGPVVLNAGPQASVSFGSADEPLALDPSLAGTPVAFQRADDGRLAWRSPGDRGVVSVNRAEPDAVVLSSADERLAPMLAELAQDPESFSTETVRPVPVTTGLRRRFEEAIARLRVGWPEMHEELVANVGLVVPIASRRTAAFSNTAWQGAVFLRDDFTDPLFLIERLTHEASHLRLNAVMACVPLHEHAWDERVDSPFRNGPRPVTGLLHGAFVFTRAASALIRVARGTAEAHRAAAQARALTDKVSTALDTLAASVRLTPAGRGLVAEIGRERDQTAAACGDVEPAAESDYLKEEM